MILNSASLCSLIVLVCNQFNFSSAIINGKQVKNFKEWSFMVQIWTKTEKFLHAGIILNEQAVVTVATKLRDYVDGRFTEVEIIAGQLVVDSTPKKEDRYSIYGILLHPNYLKDFTSPQYNVAIIKLRRLLPFKQKTPYIYPAPITKRLTPTRYNCTIAGWGSANASDPDEKNSLLYKASVFMVKPIACHINAPKILCGSMIFSHAASCNGDEGGPVICFDQEVDKHFFVHGLIWGCKRKCDSSAEVFISLCFHRKWIEHTLRVFKEDKMFQDYIT